MIPSSQHHSDNVNRCAFFWTSNCWISTTNDMHVVVTTDCSKRVMMGNAPRGTEKLHSLFGCQNLDFVVWCLSDQIFVYHRKCEFFRSNPNTLTLKPHDGFQNILRFNESTALTIAELPTRKHDSHVKDWFSVALDADNVMYCAYMLYNVFMYRLDLSPLGGS